MDLVELLAWAVGPVGGIVVGPLTAVVHLTIGIRSRHAWPLWVGSALLLSLAASICLYWWSFWRALGFTMRAEPAPVPTSVASLEMTGLALSAVLCLALVVSSARLLDVAGARDAA